MEQEVELILVGFEPAPELEEQAGPVEFKGTLIAVRPVDESE